jgi:multidrug resistance efflux pump
MSDEQKRDVTIPLPRTEPIPVPWSVRWREFRMSALPVIVFLLVTGATVVIWQSTATSTGVAGVGEGVRSQITSPTVARIQSIMVRPYEMVNAGDPVAVVIPIDPSAGLGLLQADMDLARLTFQPSVAERNSMNFEQIRVDLLTTKAELEIAKVNLARFENQVRRNEPLFKEKLVSEDVYDLSLKTRDMFSAEVIAKSNAVAQIEKRLVELQSLGVPQAIAPDSALGTTIQRLEGLRTQLATNWAPITLRAPITGMVGSVARQAGESAVEGEILLTINALTSERVVAYLRQPYPIDPHVGQEVVMITRERKPRRLNGSIVQVGAQVEMITNALAFIRTGSLIDVGLPIVVSIPPEVSIRPGEILDITFRAAQPTGGFFRNLIPPAAPAAASNGREMAVQ